MKNKIGNIFLNYVLFYNILILSELNFSLEQNIDNILLLGGKNFRYNHISLNSKGDMIIDTTSNPGSNERKFFGLKKNGRPYFFDENNKETPYRSLYVSGLENTNQEKIEGESNFIILSNQSKSVIKEYLVSFSKGYDNYMELYDFDNDKIYFKKNSKIFKKNITSDVNIFIKSENKADDKYNYYISYINFDSDNNKYIFQIIRCYFTSVDISSNGYHLDTGNKKTTINKAITSCFELESKNIGCFFQKNDYRYTISSLNETLGSEENVYISRYSTDIYTFFKAILFKGEIGAFIYYTSINDTYPILSLKYCNEAYYFYDYKNFGEIKVNKMSFSAHAMMNDIITLNENKICFISISADKNSLIIVMFNFYNNDQYLTIRYYSYDMYNNYNIKFYNDLRISSFNGYLTVAFSHCPQNTCSDINDLHYSSLIIFNYPNITDGQSEDLTDYIYLTNDNINNFSFIVDKNLNCEIENNIFSYYCKGIKILNYPDNTTLIYKNNKNVIDKNSFLTENENLSLIFHSNEKYIGMNYTIEYAFAVSEPKYSVLNNYASYIDNSYGNSQIESNSYTQNEYVGKTGFFNLTIRENLTSYCNDKCSLCYERDIDSCVTCKYNYTFNISEKICFSNPVNETTIIDSSSISSVHTSLIELSSIPNTSETSSVTSLSISTINSLSVISTIPVNNSLLSTFISSISSSLSTSSSLDYSTSNIIASSFSSSSVSPLTTAPLYTNLLTTSFTDEKYDLSNQTNNYTTSTLIVNNNYKCTNQQIIEGLCNEIITSEQIEEIYNYIKKNIINNTNYNREDNIIISTKNVAFQISDVEQQKVNGANLSSIDLGECEQALKEKENLTDEDDLIIFKIDIKSSDLSLTYVQYEIYNPKTMELINLDVCKSIPITINTPVNLDTNIELLYISLNNSGYNLFNLNDSFYNDICSTYTTQNGTDISMADRKNLIYDNISNISLCQEGCEFINYDYNSKKAECQCDIQANETLKTETNELKYDKIGFIESFYKTLKYSNFLVLKCFKLIFSSAGQSNNIGSYIMLIILFIFTISIIMYYVQGNKIIDLYIKNLINEKIINSGRNCYITEIPHRLKEKYKKKKKKKKKKKNSFVIKKRKSCNINKSGIKIFKFKAMKLSNAAPLKRKINTLKEIKYLDRDSSNISNRLLKNVTSNRISNRSLKEKSDLINKNSALDINNNKENNVEQKNKSKILLTEKTKKLYYIQDKIYNDIYWDIEMNDLNYTKAHNIDKRTFFQYYWSIIKRNQLIIFTFFSGIDYNIFQIKICLLLIYFSVSFTINGFFFTDETMNNIYINSGIYNIIYQIPQVLYSLILSVSINFPLKKLSLTDKDFLKLKRERNYIIAKQNSIKVKKKIKIKIIIFSIISFLFMIFFWYFISCFCAVYKNTQNILIIDTILSFILTILYPFGLHLLTSMLRYNSLRTKKIYKTLLFFLGNLISNF